MSNSSNTSKNWGHAGNISNDVSVGGSSDGKGVGIGGQGNGDSVGNGVGTGVGSEQYSLKVRQVLEQETDAFWSTHRHWAWVIAVLD